MIDVQWVGFLLAISLLTLSPGADTVMVTRNSLRGGFKDGVITSLGICLGLFVHAAVSALGLSLILLGNDQLFNMVKLVGAAYLVWLGAQSFYRAYQHPQTGANINAAAGKLRLWRSLREGFLSNTLNPKTAVFYLAFLPQFMNENGHLLLQALVLAGIHFIISMAWQTVIAATVDKAKALLNAPSITRKFDALVGAALICIGVSLAVAAVAGTAA